MNKITWAVLVLVAGILFWPGPLEAQTSFPHERHSVFFSDCGACHAGIAGEDPSEAYPDPSICSACHDGTTAPLVEWEKPEQRPSNLRFTHGPHEFGCAFCHQPGGPEDVENLAYPEPETCLGCHAPEAPGHLTASGSCQLCHVPVGSSRLPSDAASSFPAPETHSSAEFLTGHGPLAADFTADCSVCHDRSSCLTCHGGFAHLPDAILAIPGPVEGGPRGVETSRSGPGGFHPAGFATAHGAEAVAGQPECTSCHSESNCLQCHDGVESSGFHPLNFMASHGPEAYGRMSECTSCHNSEGFCRECHLNLGFQGRGGVVAPFHDNQALWVLSHPQAARQDLESCVSCHQQADCLRCHSARSGLRISPHGPDFDPSRISDRNQAMCIVCHLQGA
ncbi:MAG: hypothetical protein PVJ76_10575 [Gemmatimonadota bacterium]